MTITEDELRALKSGDYRYVPAAMAAPTTLSDEPKKNEWSWTKIYDAVVDDVAARLEVMRSSFEYPTRDHVAKATHSTLQKYLIPTKRICAACATELGVKDQMYTYDQWIAERERAAAAEDKIRGMREVLDRIEKGSTQALESMRDLGSKDVGEMGAQSARARMASDLRRELDSK